MKYLLHLLLLLALTPALVFARAKTPAKGKAKATREPPPALAAIQDQPGLPRVLLIGDIVSMSYTLEVRERLKGAANVHRPPLNCTHSQFGIEHLVEWLGGTPWDVIHFNFGLNDLILGKDGQPEVPLARYESNLRLLVAKMRAHSPRARLVFATTTPAPKTGPDARWRFADSLQDAYAAAARKVMTEAGVAMDDLRAAVEARTAELQVPGNANFRAPGVALLADTATASIRTALQTPAPPAPDVASAGAGLRVFTAGHSFHVWVVPILAEMAMDAGITGHQIAGRSSIGGSTVLKHWDVPDDKNTAREVLRAGKADVLTLAPIWLPDEGIDRFAGLAVGANPKIVITVQKYWMPNDEYNPVYPLDTRKKVDHNATAIAALQKAQDAYDRDIDAYVAALNQKLGTHALLTVPVGQAVVRLREKVIAGDCPGIQTQSELFRDSWGHPTPPVMALSGYCHFAIIYKRSPVGLPRPSVLARNPAWDDKLNHLLQELAWDAVTKHPPGGVK